MAGITSSSTNRVGGRVRVLNIRPASCGFVASLTNRCRDVRCGIRLRSQIERRGSMAASTPGRDRYAAMKPRRQPACVTALVTSYAIGRSRNMRRALAGGIAAVVAARAIGGAGEGAVVCLGSGPDRGRFVAALAVCCGGQM